MVRMSMARLGSDNHTLSHHLHEGLCCASQQRRRGLHTYPQTIWGLPDVSRVPVAKHPRFGRYFWALFEAVVGRDLMTSFDRPRAESLPALALELKLVAASTAAIMPKDPTIDFTLII